MELAKAQTDDKKQQMMLDNYQQKNAQLQEQIKDMQVRIS